jgi:hypothetical protein
MAPPEPASEKEAFVAALRYVANCLVKNEVYDIASDEIVNGDRAKALMVDFLRRLARDDKSFESWRVWVARTRHLGYWEK